VIVDDVLVVSLNLEQLGKQEANTSFLQDLENLHW
jgi:hypothetical protein